MPNASRKEDERRSSLGQRLLRRRTVLIIDDLGKIASFQVGKAWLVALMTWLVVLLFIFVYGVVSFNMARTDSKHLAQQLNSAEEQLAAAEKAREKALVRLLVLEGKQIQASKEAGSSSGGESAKGEKRSKEPGDLGREPLRTAPEAGSGGGTGSPSSVQAEQREAIPAGLRGGVAVGDLEIWEEQRGSRFKYQFVVKRTDRKTGKASGYTFIVLNPREGSGESARVTPETSLKDGKPGVFKNGQAFSIARYKFVRGTLAKVKSVDHFESATLYVFSDTGEILEQKTFQIVNVLRS